MRPLFLAAFLLVSIVSSNAASIVLNAGLTRNGFDEVGGDDLDAGNLIRTGFFDVSDAEIILNQANLAYLNSHFREFENGIVGAGVNQIHGHISATLTNSSPTDTAFLSGKQIYIWAIGSADFSTEAQALATIQQHAIMYLPLAIDSDWAFGDDLTPARNPSMRDLTVNGDGDVLSPNARLLIGTFGPGTSDVSGKPNFTLVAVPEPGSAAMLVASASLLGVVRRRR